MTVQNDLKPGDLVKLKSGGPVMTYIGDDSMFGDALCCWFSGSDKKTDCFLYAALQRSESP